MAEINVAFKPNSPSSIGYDPETIEIDTTDTDGKYTIKWNASSQGPLVSGYQLCQETNGSWQSDSSCLKEEKTTYLSEAFPASGTGTMPSGKYRYRVRAYAKSGSYYQYSDWSTSLSFYVKHYPVQVTGWQEPGGSTLPGASFQLKWNAVSDPDPSDPVINYDLEWSVNGSGFSDVFTINPTSELVTINKATTGKEISADNYEFRVSACNSSGCGPWSSIKRLTPPSSLEPEFSENHPTQFFKLDQEISWKDIGASSYQLERIREGESDWTTVVAATTDLSYFDGGSQPGTYQYKLSACNGFECASVLSPWIKVHNLANTDSEPAVATEEASTPGTLPYSTDVSATGNAIINIPLRPAPGVNGLQPDLSLYYTSARFQKRMTQTLPEDTLGYGWRLGGLSSIRRCVVNRPNGDKVQLRSTDSLCLDGEPLVLASGTHWEEGAQYRTLRDSFRLIELQKNSDEKIWFKVKTPSGSINEYGSTADSRLRGENTTHFAWSLNKVTDAFGNTMEYKYHRDLIEGINYPLEITYGNQGDAKIEFQYGIRTDAPPVPLQEIQQEQLVLLHHIRVHLDGKLQREYKLISEEEPADSEEVHYRRLKQVQLCAYDVAGTNRQCLNPLVFSWKYTDHAIEDDFEHGIETVTNGLGAQTKFTLERISDNPGEENVGRFDEGTTLFGAVVTIPDARPTSRAQMGITVR
ncbi:SpvB/TcaC N-terminal domain-containing protein [Microbulbifer sp. SSSA005]|uniref:SpvB/TcaC N-terminal domain-containing protein n=1 Tax=Microbulbifer sp. SSSA005 TaxID=3243378 RepID=UPI00403A4140